MRERRSAPRLQDCDLVMLTWVEGGTPLKQLANVENISETGVGLVVDNELPPGAKVSLSYGEKELTGTVRHQSSRDRTFVLGIEFDEGSQFSVLHFDPELLVRQE